MEENKEVNTPVEGTAEPPEQKQVTLSITDISSPSLGNFSIKANGKTHVMLTPDKLEALELPVYDAAKYAKRNDYTNHVKHEIAEAIKAGKWNREDVIFTWGAEDDKFPMPVITAPAQKEKKVKQVEEDLVFDLGLTANNG